MSIVGIVSSEISIALGLRGVSHVLSTGCTSSTDAIGYAAALIRHGEADVLLTGGADACVTPGMIFGFCRMRVVVDAATTTGPREASRPFDRGRDGFVLGEGAWMMTLEREDRARARGARVYATIDGYGSTCDAYHRVQMDPDGAEIVRAMTLALERAGRAARRDRLRQLSRHVDRAQRRGRVAVRAAGVRRHADRLAGIVDQVDDRPSAGRERRRRRRHGGARAVIAASCRRRSTSRDPDPACDLDFIPNTARATQVEAALCNCLGFGSKNSALVLGRTSVSATHARRPHRGAGPAGSVAALLLARAGARVLIVDREAFPRDKLCGDTLNPGGVALLASLGL